ncbi:MAG: UDP-N-acetylglucosamine 1-carboxyvinyltransferase [Patescibacteria group bacterium]|jgi:UDP-N-acetylglucosamine 1-carboxyvinyltransferase
MAKFVIEGSADLSGMVKVSGAKNAALKIIPAAIMADSPSTIHNVPNIADIRTLEDIIRSIGAKIDVDGNSVTIDPRPINSTNLDRNLTKKLRGSIVMAGPMVGKFGKVTFAQPGGCLIGARPIDSHLNVMKQFEISVEEHDDSYSLTGKPKAADIILPELSVTATENAIMTAVMASGTTTISVANAEPEIGDLIDFLNSMGAKIQGKDTHKLTIEGVSELHGVTHRVIPDRIEAGTFLCMAVATNSCIEIYDVIPDHMAIVLKKLADMGANFSIKNKDGKYNIITQKRGELESIDIDPRTYPGFPTDLQSVYAALSTQSDGPTRIFETLFESRFAYISELKKMGANIAVESPHIVYVYGPEPLVGCEIESNDIRGGAALVAAALIANGTTTINNIELIDRGYEKIDEKLHSLGTNIVRK